MTELKKAQAEFREALFTNHILSRGDLFDAFRLSPEYLKMIEVMKSLAVSDHNDHSRLHYVIEKARDLLREIGEK